MTSLHIEPLVLEGRHVRLEPLTLDHVDPLCAVGLDESLWRWTVARLRTPDDMRAYVDSALAAQRGATALPFVTIERSSGRVVGSTRFGNIDLTNRRVEIGWTWIAPAWQRTAVNTEAKYLQLRHAFETLRCVRVELKTDARNERSRAAIVRLGAKEEGTLRRHMRNADGHFRDTVYYSVLDDEWPVVKAKLARWLERR